MRAHKVLYITYDGVLEPIAQSQVLNYIKELSKKGFKFYLLSFEKKRYLSNIDSLSELDNDLNEKGIKWFRLKYHSRPKVLSTFFDIIIGILFCSITIWKNKIDIVHARSEVSATVAWVVSRLFRTKLVYDRRGIVAYDYIEGGMWPKDAAITKIIFRLANSLDKRFLLSSDHVVVLTQRIAEILRKDFLGFKKELKIRVIPCCADLGQFRPKKKAVATNNDFVLSNKFTLLYVGSLGTWYMLEEMVNFFIELKRNRKNAHLLVITLSAHDYAKSIMTEKNLKLEDYTIIGRKYRDMPDYIASADAAIMFIKPVFSKLASCPTKFAECLACGIPIVINSRIGDTQDLIKRTRVGVVVNDFSIDNYKEAVRKLLLLLEDKGLRRRCRVVARENFSLEYGVKNYLEVYRSLQ